MKTLEKQELIRVLGLNLQLVEDTLTVRNRTNYDTMFEHLLVIARNVDDLVMLEGFSACEIEVKNILGQYPRKKLSGIKKVIQYLKKILEIADSLYHVDEKNNLVVDGLYGNTTIEDDGVEIRVENGIVAVEDNSENVWKIGPATAENMEIAYAEVTRLVESWSR